MIAPTWDIAYTTDDASDTTPSWTTVSNSNVRSVSVSRGRESELGRVEAGTATLVLNNRTNLFNPVVTTGLRPMNRWRLRATYNAVTYDIFLGYAESYEQQWPGTGKDAITVVRLVDEFKVLALDRLPDFDPTTADTYAGVVQFDNPQGYWQMQDAVDLRIMEATVGGVTLTQGTIGRVTGAVVGDPDVDLTAGVRYGARSTTADIRSIDGTDASTFALDAGAPGDASGLSAFTYEQWFKSSEATPASERIIAEGPWNNADSAPTWAIALTTTGKIRGYVFNTVPTLATSTGSTSISANTWYHIALVYNGTNVLIYLNGVQDGTAALTGSVISRGTVSQYLSLGRGSPGGTRYYDEVAFYRYAVAADRLLAHYTAGTARGYVGGVNTGDRVDAVLDDSTSANIGRSVAHDTRFMLPAYMNGRSPLDLIRDAEAAENVDTIFYIAADGTITFLGSNHRSNSPWNSVQATFDDDGTDLPYRDCTVDYGETFLFNEWTANAAGQVVVTASDSTSISRYYKRSQQLGELQNEGNGDTQDIVDDMLAKYKDPLTRVTSITVDLKTSAVISAVLGLELAERIRILRTNVGGGTRIDQTSFIQSIQLTATPDRPWQIRFGVSPQ